jgi:hypothetical protein
MLFKAYVYKKVQLLACERPVSINPVQFRINPGSLSLPASPVTCIIQLGSEMIIQT